MIIVGFRIKNKQNVKMLHYIPTCRALERQMKNKPLSAAYILAYILARWPAANRGFEPRGKHTQFILNVLQREMVELHLRIHFTTRNKIQHL